VSPLQPYSSKEEAQSAGPDSSAGYAADSGIVRPAIQVECGERIDLGRVSGIGGTQAKAVGVSPGVVPPVLLPARACSSTPTATMSISELEKACPAPTGLAENAYPAVGPARHTCCLL